jgi:LuxR family glucitol operon transcriptional activator
MTPEMKQTAKRRQQSEQRGDQETREETDDLELLSYIDFVDLSKIIHLKLEKYSKELGIDATAFANCVDKLGPIRNRVCHSRPLDTGELTNCIDIVDSLLGQFRGSFDVLRDTRQRLNERPLEKGHEQIPAYWNIDDIQNNLPSTDFDETGFLGRVEDKRKLRKLLKGAYPVITVVGEGGVGKSALALQCLYDLMDDSTNPFEAIVWVSLKTAVLTGDGVRQLRDSINTTLGMLTAVASELGTSAGTGVTVETLVKEISEDLKSFKILIVLDNLETIRSDKMLALCESMPRDSKLLLTSRVGLGDYEQRFQLNELDQRTAVTLMRKFSSLLQVDQVYKEEENALKDYCSELYCNPLLIKWFVSAVSKGTSVSALLRKGGSTFQEALDYCFTGVFENLNDAQRTVVNVLIAAKRPISEAELRHLCVDTISHDAVEETLGWLRNCSMVRSENTEKDGNLLVLSTPAAEYLTQKKPPSKEEFQRVQKKLSDLQLVDEWQGVRTGENRWNTNFVHNSKTKDERVAAVRLHNVLRVLRKEKNPGLARTEIELIKKLVYDYSEVYRISAMVAMAAGDNFAAQGEFEQALKHNPDSNIARFQFAQFLRTNNQPVDAIPHLDNLLERSPTDLTLRLEKASALTWAGKHQDASEMYEKVLDVFKNKPESDVRKVHRIASDQAADCYRRLLETDIRNKDWNSGRTHAGRSIEILSRSVLTNDWDNYTQRTLFKVFDEVIRYFRATNDREFFEESLANFETLAKVMKPARLFYVDRYDQFDRVLVDYPSLAERVKKICSPTKEDSDQWGRIEDCYRENKRISGRVIEQVNGGLSVDVLGTLCFLPSSEIFEGRNRRAKKLDDLRGKEFILQIIELNAERRSPVVSRKRALISPEARKSASEARTRRAKSLVLDQAIDGTVVNVVDYGVFVDLGDGLDGLLHVSKISSLNEGEHPSLKFAIGAEVQVVVKEVNLENNHVTLTDKQESQ